MQKDWEGGADTSGFLEHSALPRREQALTLRVSPAVLFRASASANISKIICFFFAFWIKTLLHKQQRKQNWKSSHLNQTDGPAGKHFLRCLLTAQRLCDTQQCYSVINAKYARRLADSWGLVFPCYSQNLVKAKKKTNYRTNQSRKCCGLLFQSDLHT